jgi:glycosyltransferase involved in cell wall biosynthesis
MWGLPGESPDLVLSAELPRLDRFADRARLRSSGRIDWDLSDEFAFGYVGRLVPEKGIDWLLRSWQAAGLSSKARLLFVGEGPLEDTVRAAAMADPRIRLIGSVPFERVPMVMASLDVLILPSLTTTLWCEQYGRVLTEAMASGLPVVASRSGAIPEVVDNAGLLVSEASIIDLAGAMGRLEVDHAERDRLSRLGLGRAATAFSPAVGAANLTDFWQRAVGSEVR